MAIKIKISATLETAQDSANLRELGRVLSTYGLDSIEVTAAEVIIPEPVKPEAEKPKRARAAKVETPVVETPAVETPVVETPAEAPAAESPAETTAVEAPAVEAPDEPTTSPSGVTEPMARQKVQQAIQAGKTEKVKEILASIGAKNVSGIPVDRYDEVYRKLSEV